MSTTDAKLRQVLVATIRRLHVLHGGAQEIRATADLESAADLEAVAGFQAVKEEAVL